MWALTQPTFPDNIPTLPPATVQIQTSITTEFACASWPQMLHKVKQFSSKTGGIIVLDQICVARKDSTSLNCK